METIDMLQESAQVIYDRKGLNILALDVRGLSTITDYLLIAEGNVDRHVLAIAQQIIQEFKAKGVYPLRTEGMATGDWVVIDYGVLMIHLFMPGLREKYSLERLWNRGSLVDLIIDTKRPSLN